MARPYEIVASVAVGGAAGSVARYLVGAAISSRAATAFPTGTLVINIVGCLMIGFLMRLFVEVAEIPPALRALLVTGMCGGFTTFSTFEWETFSALEEAAFRRSATYVAASVLFGFAAVWAGSTLARLILTTLRSASGQPGAI